MAILNVLSTFTCKLIPNFHKSHATSFRMCYQTTTRRSGNYEPPTWDYTYIQSLNTNHYSAERFVTRRDELKERAKDMLKNEEMKELEKMEMIDELQRLGCGYHFEDEIKKALMDIYMKKKKISNSYKSSEEKDLYATALEFRVLRQNGFNISQDVFDDFMDRERSCFNDVLCKDTKGLLNLYEASYLLMEGETTLELARDFSTKYLKRITQDQNLSDPVLLASVQHALELPLHWRMPRLEARCFIDSYGKRKTTSNNPILLELAKLDFNIVQAVHLEDLRFVSRWWKNSYITEKLRFVRDRLVENFMWGLAQTSNPKYANCRRTIAKLNSIICTVDDIYDVYGTLDELQLFTDTIERWDDITEIEHLPEYMKFCYFGLHNFVNEVAYDILKEHNLFTTLHHLRKGWVDLCKAYLQEAKWYHSGYTPTYEEYIENSWISIGVPLTLVHAFTYVNNPVKETDLNCLTKSHELFRFSSMISRLANDKATSPGEMIRGDVQKVIQCYTSESKVSINDAHDYINSQIDESWKKINKILLEDGSFDKKFIDVAMNIARMAQCIYQHGDGHSMKVLETQTRFEAILFEPIPLI